METQTWLDKGNFSKSIVKVNEENIHIAVYYSNNFQLSKYLYKVLSLTNITIENLKFNFEKNEIKIVLGK